MSLNFERRSVITLTLIIIIGLGIALRIVASRGWPLWQDEAETTINSLQVIDQGFPGSTYRGKPLFENAVVIPAPPSDPKYAYLSTNYATSNLERNKGWLTFYLEAAFLKFFGFSTFVARLPFVLIAGASLLLVYKLGRRLFGTQVGLAASGLASINYYSIINERQARYLSLEIFLVLACLLAFHIAITQRQTRSYVWSGVVLALLFYTHMVAAFALGLFFLAAHIHQAGNLRSLTNQNVLITLGLTALLTAPWIIGVKLWTLTTSYTDVQGPITWGLIILLLAVIYVFAHLAVPSLRLQNFRHMNGATYLVLAILTIVITKPLVTPYESLAARLFVEVNPILVLLLAALIRLWWQSRVSTSHHLRLGATAALLIGALYLFNDGLGKFQDNIYDSRWVTKTIAYLDQRQVDTSTPIFVTYHQFPFMVYSDYNVDLVWPLRQSYIDTYPDRFFFVYNRLNTNLRMFYHPPRPTADELPFANRIDRCTRHPIDSETDIYECPALTSGSET